MKRPWLRAFLGLVLCAILLGHSAGHVTIAFLDRLDAMAYDGMLRLTAPGGVDDRVVIVDIDERALREVGRWPWRRDRLADLVDHIFDQHGALILGLDVILAEPDESSGLKALAGLAQGPLRHDVPFQSALTALRPALDVDQRLADAIARHPVVLAYHLHGEARAPGRSGTEEPRPSVLPAGAFGAAGDPLPEWPGYIGSLPAFQAAAMGTGHINGMPDPDGVVRRVPLIVKVDGVFQEAFGLAMVRVLAAKASIQPVFTPGGGGAGTTLEALSLATPKGALRIAVDPQARALIPYRGPAGSFRYVSAADVLANRVPEGILDNRIVLLGATAPGLVDLRVAPVGAAYPGVEIHANLISGILDGRVKALPGYMAGLQLILLAAIGVLMVGVIPGRSPRVISLVAGLLVMAVLGLQGWLWQGLDLVLPIAPLLAMIVLLYALNMVFGYFLEVHNRHSMARLFGQYVPPELVLEMSRDPDRYGMEGRNAELSVLFADIRGFTALSEGMPAEDLARMVNVFFSAMTAVVREQRGTLDKYLGDAVMAFWGAPMADPQHANHAVATALAMQARLATINTTFPERGWPRLAIGIGINTGDMTVGDMGSNDRRAYTVLGDAVNLAARFVDLTAYYDVGIVIGEATRQALQGVVCRQLDRVTVQGRAGAVTLYEPLGLATAVDPAIKEELGRWEEFLVHYRAGHWNVAEEVLQTLGSHTPQRLHRLYQGRITELRGGGAPLDWDGVWHFDQRVGPV